MKLLIVEDDSSLAEITAELLRSFDVPLQRFEAITLAADLQTAIRCLPEHDVILCDGMFPVSPESTLVVDEWDVVRTEACRRGIHFVLYSGSARALDCARESNTPALTKPAAIEEIYAALTCDCLPGSGDGVAEAALVEPCLAGLALAELVMAETKEPPPGKIMTETLDDYCRNLETQVAALGQQVEMDARLGHLQAFNFGRSLGRMEVPGRKLWVPVRWLILGAAVGAALATVFLLVFMNPHAIFSIAR